MPSQFLRSYTKKKKKKKKNEKEKKKKNTTIGNFQQFKFKNKE